jgi:hypothetical protein
MYNTLVQARPTTFSSISPDMAGVCLFSLLGVMLSAAVLSYTPSRVPAWTVLKNLTDHPNRIIYPVQKMHDMSFVFSEAN